MTPNVTLGDKIRIMRAVRNITQGRLAEKAGLPKFIISYFENDHAIPTPTQIQAIKTALDWPPQAEQAFAFLTGNSSMNLSKMLDEAIGLYLEFEKVHGYDPERARAAAVIEILQGLDALEDINLWEQQEKQCATQEAPS